MAEGDAGVSRVRQLLEQAVRCLDGQISNDSSHVHVVNQPQRNTADPCTSASVSDRSEPARNRVQPPSSSSALSSRPPTTPSSRIAALAERNALFNFTERGKRSAKGSVRKSKKKRLELWTRDFICLAKVDQEKCPTATERATLITAGLGTKKLSFIQPGDSDDIHLVIMEAFPKLEEAGGYELARANSSRMLEIIPTPADGYSVAFLKDVIGQGKIYIRPIQRNLSLDPVAPTSTGWLEDCFKCGEAVPLTQLRSHLECYRRRDRVETNVVVIDEWDSDLDDFDLPPVNLTNRDTSNVEREREEQNNDESVEVERVVRDAVVQEPHFVPTSLEEVITHLQRFLEDEIFEFQVRREYVFEDLLEETKKVRFHPLKRVKTWFVGESGRDIGGVTRELWRLLGHGVASLCEGQSEMLVFRHDTEKVGTGDFKRVGILVGMSLIQGGSGFPFFAPSMYDYICGRDVCSIAPTVDEIPDAQLKTALVELNSAPDDVAVRNIAMGACDVLLDCGYTKPLSQLKLNDVPQLIKLAALHSTVLRIKSELDQFITGISEAGCLHAIQEYSALFIPMFVASDNIKLNADFILELFKEKIFSDQGSSAFTREQSTYMFFRNLLHEVEGGELDISLGDILSFFTGTNNIPPLGLESATLNFSPINHYPTSSTCALHLTLPTKYYNDYSAFKENFVYAIQNHGGFGLY